MMPAARILLVDDDQIFRLEFLDCFKEYGVVEACSGEEALKILKKPNEIDLVMLDVRMAGMDGIAVLEQIKKITPDIRVVIFTGYSSKDVAIEALRGRADDYLEKPLDIKATKEIIEKHLEGKDRAKYGQGIEDKINRAKDFISRNFHKKVTLNDAASAVCLSPKYLSRIFKEHVKSGFSEYKLALKIEKAKNMLKKTTDTVEQISDKLGYENSESFIRQFKKITKVTPAKFRLKVRKKK